MTHLLVKLAGAIDPVAAASPAKKSAAVETQSFADELSQTFAAARSKVGIGVASQTGGASQANVVRQNPVAVIAPVPAAIDPKPVNKVTPPPPPPPPPPVVTDTMLSEDDVYWGAQPAAVQQLRNLDDPSQRAALGAQLASQGYSIDTPVMIWGWDPQLTTQLRQSFGYTWVPSALQPPITAAPGITGAGITPYDPNHPPPGSISV